MASSPYPFYSLSFDLFVQDYPDPSHLLFWLVCASLIRICMYVLYGAHVIISYLQLICYVLDRYEPPPPPPPPQSTITITTNNNNLVSQSTCFFFSFTPSGKRWPKKKELVHTYGKSGSATKYDLKACEACEACEACQACLILIDARTFFAILSFLPRSKGRKSPKILAVTYEYWITMPALWSNSKGKKRRKERKKH